MFSGGEAWGGVDNLLAIYPPKSEPLYMDVAIWSGPGFNVRFLGTLCHASFQLPPTPYLQKTSFLESLPLGHFFKYGYPPRGGGNPWSSVKTCANVCVFGANISWKKGCQKGSQNMKDSCTWPGSRKPYDDAGFHGSGFFKKVRSAKKTENLFS